MINQILDFLSIPLDSDRDVHICGRCKIMYYNLTEFMDHKLTECGDVKENESKEGKKKVFSLRFIVFSLQTSSGYVGTIHWGR